MSRGVCHTWLHLKPASSSFYIAQGLLLMMGPEPMRTQAVAVCRHDGKVVEPEECPYCGTTQTQKPVALSWNRVFGYSMLYFYKEVSFR